MLEHYKNIILRLAKKGDVSFILETLMEDLTYQQWNILQDKIMREIKKLS